MVYEVWAGGFHAVQAKLDIDQRKKDRYGLVLTAHTRGLLGSLAPWEGSFESYGWAENYTNLKPELHKSTAIWRDEKEIKEYKYTKDGGFKELVITDHDKPAEKREVSGELTDGTTDALTATLLTLQAVAEGAECESSNEVFDGKRRYNLVFKHEGYKELKASRYNIFEGQAAECTVEVVPVAGDWHKKPRGWMSIQEQGRERGTIPTVWMAQLEKNGPAVPVKIRVKTEFGTLFMHLAEYQNNEQIKVAEKRVLDDE